MITSRWTAQCSNRMLQVVAVLEILDMCSPWTVTGLGVAHNMCKPRVQKCFCIPSETGSSSHLGLQTKRGRAYGWGTYRYTYTYTHTHTRTHTHTHTHTHCVYIKNMGLMESCGDSWEGAEKEVGRQEHACKCKRTQATPKTKTCVTHKRSSVRQAHRALAQRSSTLDAERSS